MKYIEKGFLIALTITFISINSTHAQFVLPETEEILADRSVVVDTTGQTAVNEPVKSTIDDRLAAHDEEKVLKDDGYHFGVWVNYQQKFGAINDKFFTIGGPSIGFNLGRYFFLGAGIYSTFGASPFDGEKDHSLVYGGGIVGFRWNPQHPVVFRTQVLVGAASFDVVSTDLPGLIEHRTTSLIVVPEIGLDIRLVGHLYLSFSATYHYVQDLPDVWKDFKGLGALSGAASIGLSF